MILHCNKRAMLFLLFAIRSTLVVLCRRSDLIFATSTPLTAGIPGIIGKIFLRRKFVFEVRDLWPELPVSMGVISNKVIIGILSALEKVSYRSSDRVFGLSPGICRGVSRIIPSGRVSLIPNGCDLSIFTGDVQRVRPPDLADDAFVYIYSGTCGRANNVANVINAASILKKRGNEVIKIIIIGGGREKTGLQNRVRMESIDNVLFLESVSKDALSQYYAGSDCGLQILDNIPAFYYGTSPNKFFDYIAAGLPVLCNYPGWVSDLLDRYSCGVSVTPDDPVLLADAMESLSVNARSVSVMRKGAIRLAEMVFDRSRLAGIFVEELEGVVRC